MMDSYKENNLGIILAAVGFMAVLIVFLVVFMACCWKKEVVYVDFTRNIKVEAEPKSLDKIKQELKKDKVNGAGQKKVKTEKQKVEAEPKSLDKIKQELKKSPSKPKRRRKFNNFVRTQYKLTDDKAVEELWVWYKDAVIST